MALRKIPLITGEIYHLFNRGINKQPIFFGTRDYKRAMQILDFYTFSNPMLRFSKFLQLNQNERAEFLKKLKEKGDRLVEIIAFCFMPNHFHLLLKQKRDNGISLFMSIFQNSYTRYVNTKNDKSGPLLQGSFKSVRIEDDDQLLHVSRYIHLNPYTSFLIKNLSDLGSYPWSSFPEYLGKTENNFCSKDIILSQFKNAEDYKQFVFDQGDYQRKLEQIKHLAIDQ